MRSIWGVPAILSAGWDLRCCTTGGDLEEEDVASIQRGAPIQHPACYKPGEELPSIPEELHSTDSVDEEDLGAWDAADPVPGERAALKRGPEVLPLAARLSWPPPVEGLTVLEIRRHGPSEDLGLRLLNRGMGALIVEEILEMGAVAAWNRSQERRGSECRLWANDEIVAVNGVRGDEVGMISELKASSVLRLQVVRRSAWAEGSPVEAG